MKGVPVERELRKEWRGVVRGGGAGGGGGGREGGREDWRKKGGVDSKGNLTTPSQVVRNEFPKL